MKGMKIVFALVVISVMAMSLGSANAATIYETDFEAPTYSGGYATVVGQDGWVGFYDAQDGSPPTGLNASDPTPDAWGIEYQWLNVTMTGPKTSGGLHANGLYRQFAAQTGQVRLEALYQPNASRTSLRGIYLRDSSDAGQATIAAMVGSGRNRQSGPGYDEFFAADGESTVYNEIGAHLDKTSWYKIVIDANVATQTYDATVNFYTLGVGVGAQVVSWTDLSFANAVTDISRVYVVSQDSMSRWDNFSITPEPATLAVLALGGFAVLLRRKR